MDDGAISMTGFDLEALKQAPEVLQGAIDSGDLAGGVTLIWRKGEVVQLELRGKRDIARDLPMERDTLFRIASMTKPITTVAALMLMEEGKLALTDPITRWAPEFANMRVHEVRRRPGRGHGPGGAGHHHRRPDDPPLGPVLRLLLGGADRPRL